MQYTLHITIHILGAITLICLTALFLSGLLFLMDRDWRECSRCGRLFKTKGETWTCLSCENAAREAVTKEFQEAAGHWREDQDPNRMEVRDLFKRASCRGRFRI